MSASASAADSSALHMFTFVNKSSCSWLVQLTRLAALLRSHDGDEPQSASASDSEELERHASLHHFVMQQSPYPIPDEGGVGEVRIGRRVPRFSLQLLTRSANFFNNTGSETQPSDQLFNQPHRTFDIVDGGSKKAALQLQPAAPFVAAHSLAFINHTASTQYVGIKLDGALFVAVEVPPPAPVTRRTVVQLQDTFFYRIVPLIRSGKNLALFSTSSADDDWNKWSKADFRPFTLHTASSGLEVTLVTEFGELIWEEKQISDSDAAAPSAGDAASSKKPVKFLLTGDPTQPSTQVALLVMLEKEMKQFNLKAVRTTSLALNHPLRSPSSSSASAHSSLSVSLPFLNLDSSASDPSASGALGTLDQLTRALDEKIRTGSKLIPAHSASLQRMEDWLARLKQDIIPLLEKVVNESHFGSQQGHRARAGPLQSFLDQLAPVLQSFEDELSPAGGASDALKATSSNISFTQPAEAEPEAAPRPVIFLAGTEEPTLPDFYLLPYVSLLHTHLQHLNLQASQPHFSSPASLHTTLQSLFSPAASPCFSKYFASMQSRRSWQLLQLWLAKHETEASRDKFEQQAEGAPFWQ